MIRLFQKVITNWTADSDDENAAIYTVQPMSTSEFEDGSYSAYAIGVGIQGPPGLRFKFNIGSDNNNYWLPLASEPIRLGSTGIYELDLQDLEGVMINKIVIYQVLADNTDLTQTDLLTRQPIIIDLLYEVQKNIGGGTVL